jgi:hypothetical protein
MWGSYFFGYRSVKWTIVITVLLSAGCAPFQDSQNATELISTIDYIRETQVIYNIGRAIDDPEMVPAQVVMSSGSAQATTALTPTLSWAAHFVKSLSASLGVFSWTSSWTLVPVVDAGDLQNLRAVYSFIVTPLPPIQAQATLADKINAAASLLDLYSEKEAPSAPNPAPPPPPQPAPPFTQSPVPTREQAAQMLIGGVSWACQKYQNEKEHTALYNPWLFWFSDGSWHPVHPRYPVTAVGIHNGTVIYISSRACFDDFIVLVHNSIPAAHAAAANAPKTPSTIPAVAQ